MDDSQALHPQFGAILSVGEVAKGHAKWEKQNVKRDKLEHEKGFEKEESLHQSET